MPGLAFKKDSPFSDLVRVRVYNAGKGTSAHGMAQRNGTGILAREVVFCQAKRPMNV